MIAAFDASLTAIGWARSIDPAPALGPVWESGVYRSPYRGARRLRDCLTHVMKLAEGASLVMIEGYAFAAQAQAHQIGELGGVLRLGFYQVKIPVVEIPPTKLKKFATGKGSGKKEAPFGEAIRRLGYERNSHDEADALWLLQMALHHYALPGAVTLPKDHVSALMEVQWPRLHLGPDLDF